MVFDFSTATQIIFGPGTSAQAGVLAAAMGRIPLLVTGRTWTHSEPVQRALVERRLDGPIYAVPGEPTTDDVLKCLTLARNHRCDMVVGVGGGSVLDTAKAVAALAANPGDIYDYLEVIGNGRPLTSPPLAVIAVPTTSGTGSEVTRNAVLASPEHGLKVSLRSPLMYPRLALIDPDLTASMPPAVTAATGMDALAQLVEPYVSNKANAMADAFCREGLRRISRALFRAFSRGDDQEARESMSLASLFGGLALASAGLGAVHGFAGPIGGSHHAPHGAVCARLLPAVMTVNCAALKDRDPASLALARYEEIARILTGEGRATVNDGIAWIERLVQTFSIPPLSAYGINSSDFPPLCERAAGASSMKGNPVLLTPAEMREILTLAV